MVAGLKFQLRKQKKVFFKKVFQIFLSPRQDTHGQKGRKRGIPLACWSVRLQKQAAADDD